MTDEDYEPLMAETTLTNPHYTLLLYAFLLGQFRIQITDKRLLDDGAPEGHGEIVQQLCTYDGHKVGIIFAQLKYAADPLALARSWAKPWNCESPGGRIRLDNREENYIAPEEMEAQLV